MGRDLNYDRNQRPNFRCNEPSYNEGYDENTFEIEPDDVEWANRTDNTSSHDFNEYQNEGYDQQNTCDTYEVPNQNIHEYHHVSQSVRFPDTNRTPCHNCNGTGYISTRRDECNGVQEVIDCTKQISAKFDEDNDEDQEESM